MSRGVGCENENDAEEEADDVQEEVDAEVDEVEAVLGRNTRPLMCKVRLETKE